MSCVYRGYCSLVSAAPARRPWWKLQQHCTNSGHARLCSSGRRSNSSGDGGSGSTSSSSSSTTTTSSSRSSGSHVLSTHVSSDGTTPMMVDVGHKAVTRRSATARTRVRLPPEVLSKMAVVGGEVVGKKGPIFATAVIAGVLGAKGTSALIPFCHPLPIEDCKVDVSLVEGNTVIQIDCTVRVTHKTGVEMEAMTGASIAALTVYDMLKGLSHDITIESTCLLAKDGGKRPYRRE